MIYLYRGVSTALHEKNRGLLVPKATGPFEYPAIWDETIWDSGETWGRSAANAAIRHQRNQRGIPTSGVSTTPHLERAEFYATHAGKLDAGIVYKIDRTLLSAHGVCEYDVGKYATNPSIPEDEEVILVGKELGPLPEAIVAEVINVGAGSQ